MGRFVDLTGKTFGRWTVLRRTENKGVRSAWMCRCECGNERAVVGNNLVRGITVSCGCHRKEVLIKHGYTGRSEYSSWQGMKDRCLNPNSASYPDYGGRGIMVCERWLSFENFLEDMGPKPSKKYSIERIDVNGDYEPGNCKWATQTEQNHNLRVAKRNTSGVSGVRLRKDNLKWSVRIIVHNKQIDLGCYETKEED